MQVHKLSYRSTGRFAPIVLDHVEGAEDLKEFRTHGQDLDELRQAASDRSFPAEHRAVLCDALERGYSGVPISEAVRANLDALRHPATLAVTTGHQLCLFTGPLYVPFKLLNAVRLARELSTPQRRVVPVFWMATEDHDRAEIDHAWISGTKVQWPGEPAGATGALVLTGIDPVLEEVDRLLGPGAHADELRALLHEAYRPGHTLAQATRLFVNALFGRFGLVVLDASDRELKRLFAPVMREEFTNQIAQRSVAYADAKLAPHYKTQAFAREINLFHLRPGHRARLELIPEGTRALEGGPEFTWDDLEHALESRPEQFSPNVLLRPVYQETVLPNIAYIGGGGELAYWYQLRWLFQAVRIPMPALVLRTSAAFLSAKHDRRWRALGLTYTDLFLPLNELEERLARERAGFPTHLRSETSSVHAAYAAIREHLSQADRSLEGAALAEEKRALNGLMRLEKKLLRAAKRKESDVIRQMNEVVRTVLPNGLQERRDNFMPWYAQEGPAFFDRLLEALDPLDPRFSLLIEDQ